METLMEGEALARGLRVGEPVVEAQAVALGERLELREEREVLVLESDADTVLDWETEGEVEEQRVELPE
jgi:hypothetical protein